MSLLPLLQAIPHLAKMGTGTYNLINLNNHPDMFRNKNQEDAFSRIIANNNADITRKTLLNQTSSAAKSLGSRLYQQAQRGLDIARERGMLSQGQYAQNLLGAGSEIQSRVGEQQQQALLQNTQLAAGLRQETDKYRSMLAQLKDEAAQKYKQAKGEAWGDIVEGFTGGLADVSSGYIQEAQVKKQQEATQGVFDQWGTKPATDDYGKPILGGADGKTQLKLSDVPLQNWSSRDLNGLSMAIMFARMGLKWGAKEEAQPEVKEQPKEEAQPEVKEQPKEEAKPEAKEQPKEEAQPEVKEQPKEEAKPEAITASIGPHGVEFTQYNQPLLPPTAPTEVKLSDDTQALLEELQELRDERQKITEAIENFRTWAENRDAKDSNQKPAGEPIEKPKTDDRGDSTPIITASGVRDKMSTSVKIDVGDYTVVEDPSTGFHKSARSKVLSYKGVALIMHHKGQPDTTFQVIPGDGSLITVNADGSITVRGAHTRVLGKNKTAEEKSAATYYLKAGN